MFFLNPQTLRLESQFLGRCLSVAVQGKVPCWWIWHMIWWLTMMDYSMSGRIDHFLRSTQTRKDLICRGSTPNGTPTDSTKIYVFHKGGSIHSCWERGFLLDKISFLGVQPLLFQKFQLTPWNQTCFPFISFISFCTPETYPELQGRTFPLRMELILGGWFKNWGKLMQANNTYYMCYINLIFFNFLYVWLHGVFQATNSPRA